MAVKTKVLKRRELSFWDRTYLPAVFAGLAITARHFFVNGFLQTLGLLGLRPGGKSGGAVTYQYPEEQRPLSKRTRTRHRLMKRDNGATRCVACMMCETICPAKCINIVASEDPDPNIEKVPSSFDIDLGKCVYCGFCVEVCPEDAIRMDTHILDIASYSRGGMMLNIEELMNPGSTMPQKALNPDVAASATKPSYEASHPPVKK
ncbi:MAG: NADH-quinone oxidoreductase subunit I [Candidatus Omnitrophica bacterium]|jgi:NADH-quinone oxidoreductase subunit I|nr:NADH-quinone oxidoreductase subunit I [Candidatus Omnitrophota bacterium]